MGTGCRQGRGAGVQGYRLCGGAGSSGVQRCRLCRGTGVQVRGRGCVGVQGYRGSGCLGVQRYKVSGFRLCRGSEIQGLGVQAM